METYPLLKEDYEDCGQFGKMEDFVDFVSFMPERVFYAQNGMDGIIHSLPTYDDSLRETVYLISVSSIQLRSHNRNCDALMTSDLQNLGAFIHEMSEIVYGLRYSI